MPQAHFKLQLQWTSYGFCRVAGACCLNFVSYQFLYGNALVLVLIGGPSRAGQPQGRCINCPQQDILLEL